MIGSQQAESVIIVLYQPNACGIIKKKKNNQEILLDLADFVLQEQPENNLMVAFSWAWYNIG